MIDCLLCGGSFDSSLLVGGVCSVCTREGSIARSEYDLHMLELEKFRRSAFQPELGVGEAFLFARVVL